jgi:hypothetical protein
MGQAGAVSGVGPAVIGAGVVVLCETTPQPEVQAYLGGGKSVRRLFVSACRRRFRRLYRLQLWCDGGFLLEVEIDEVVGS